MPRYVCLNRARVARRRSYGVSVLSNVFFFASLCIIAHNGVIYGRVKRLLQPPDGGGLFCGRPRHQDDVDDDAEMLAAQLSPFCDLVAGDAGRPPRVVLCEKLTGCVNWSPRVDAMTEDVCGVSAGVRRADVIARVTHRATATVYTAT